MSKIPTFYDCLGNEIKTGDWVLRLRLTRTIPRWINTSTLVYEDQLTLLELKSFIVHGPTKKPHKQLWVSNQYTVSPNLLLKVQKEWNKSQLLLHLKIAAPHVIIPEKLL